MPKGSSVSPFELALKAEDRIAAGVQREVYRHPLDKSKLVKVLRPNDEMPKRTNFNGRMDRIFPSTRLRQIRKEYQEYLRIMLQPNGDKRHLPMTHMFGFAMTNLGVGCVTEAVTEADGQLGRTVGSKASSGDLSTEDIALLNSAIERIYRLGIRASDMNPANFVIGHRWQGSVMGPHECVLVDGFGDIHAIPIRSWGRLFNRFGLDDSCKRLARNTGLKWSTDTKLFHPAR